MKLARELLYDLLIAASAFMSGCALRIAGGPPWLVIAAWLLTVAMLLLAGLRVGRAWGDSR